MPEIVLGLDFDNTIVNYDGVFHRAAVEAGLISPETGRSKDQVRGDLVARGREEDWTALQGEVYGARMDLAKLFAGAAETMRELAARGVSLRIISHKTRYPYRGQQYDLHAAARGFLQAQRMLGDKDGLFTPSQVFFELTIAEKIERIRSEGCTHFLDDLPEVLGHAAFPPGVSRLLFDPGNLHGAITQFNRVSTWHALPALLLRS